MLPKNPAVVAIERHLLGTLARRIRRTNQETSKIWKEYAVQEAPPGKVMVSSDD